MAPLVEMLSLISTALLAPVVVGLLVLLVLVLLEAGGFVREWLERRNVPALPADSAGTLPVVPRGLAQVYRCRLPADADELTRERLVADLEVDASARVARLNVGLRLGPTLGLMGTLIPLGPALEGLADGRTGQIAESLIIAFATTVVGLLISGLCYLLATVRRHWYASDLSTVNYLASRQSLDEQRALKERPVDGFAEFTASTSAGRN